MKLTAIHPSRALLAAALSACLLMSACGSSGSDSGTDDPLVVGTDPTHPPHDFLNEDGDIVGWEHDFIVQVGKHMGRDVEYRAASFDALLPGLGSGRYDLVFANMGITEERLAVVDMVTAFAGGQAFLAQADSGLSLSNLDNLCGVSVGVTRGSQQVDLAEAQSKKCTDAGKKPVQVKTFQAGDQIVLAVEAKRVDTYWTAEPIAQYYANRPSSVLAIAGNVPGTRSKTAIALPKGSDLTEPVHEAVQALIDDGTYRKVLEKWDLQDSAIKTSQINPKPAA